MKSQAANKLFASATLPTDKPGRRFGSGLLVNGVLAILLSLAPLRRLPEMRVTPRLHVPDHPITRVHLEKPRLERPRVQPEGAEREAESEAEAVPPQDERHDRVMRRYRPRDLPGTPPERVPIEAAAPKLAAEAPRSPIGPVISASLPDQPEPLVRTGLLPESRVESANRRAPKLSVRAGRFSSVTGEQAAPRIADAASRVEGFERPTPVNGSHAERKRRSANGSSFGRIRVSTSSQATEGPELTEGKPFGTVRGESKTARAAIAAHEGEFGNIVVDKGVRKASGAEPESDQGTEVQILHKPRPAYTPEARGQRIEGEVQLEVLFRASGQVEILRVIESLGYGLEASAVEAARKIRFKPARRNGKEVDSQAIVTIRFQLAY